MSAALTSSPPLINSDDPPTMLRKITKVRNTLVHANYRQALEDTHSATVGDYFRSSEYIAEVEWLYKFYRHVEDQRQRLPTGPDGPRA